jgi:hypothetical protein
LISIQLKTIYLASLVILHGIGMLCFKTRTYTDGIWDKKMLGGIFGPETEREEATIVC